MNLVNVRGGKARQRKLSEEAVYFALSRLLPRHSALEINVVLDRDLDELGYCTYEDCNIKPREFTLDICSKQDDRNIVSTVLHEMVHVKQFVRQELRERYNKGYKKYWKSRVHTNTEYNDQPWEKEAHKLEIKLLNEFYTRDV